MYTNDYNEEDDDELYEETSTGSIFSNRSIIIKILIIIACIVILIWLVAALRKNNNKGVVYDPNIHSENIEKVRLAAERYFFLDGNMPKENGMREVSLFSLIKNGYVSDIVDSNSKVCNDVNSIATLTDSTNSYVLTIKLACSTNEKIESFDYSKTNYVCLNCNGKTLMEGEIVPVTPEPTSTPVPTTTPKPTEEEKNPIYDEYSCSSWSNWTTTRVSNSLLEERTRVLVKGVKYGQESTSISYGPWTEYVNTPIAPSDSVEVETAIQKTAVWSDNKTSDTKIEESDTVKLVSTEKVSSGTYNYCPKGYTKKDNKCIGETKKGDLTYIEYNSGEYLVYNRPCEAVNIERQSDGKYSYVYKNCQYSSITDLKKGTSTKKVYTYQELEYREEMVYRARTIYNNVTKTDDIYTDEYYEEDKLPSGYVKLPGSEKTEYSYKISICEK